MRRRSVLIRSAGLAGKRRDGFVDHRRLDERLIALHVDDEIAVDASAGDLGEPIGAAAMARRRHAHVAAEGAHGVDDALVVGRDDHGVTCRASDWRGGRRARSSDGRRCRASALPGSRVEW